MRPYGTSKILFQTIQKLRQFSILAKGHQVEMLQLWKNTEKDKT
jgi:hypothetical protein